MFCLFRIEELNNLRHTNELPVDNTLLPPFITLILQIRIVQD